MNEKKYYQIRKSGMGMLLLFCLLYLIAIAGCVLSAIALEHEFKCSSSHCGTSCQHYLAVYRMDSIPWTESAETTRGSGSYTFRKTISVH